MCFTHKHTKEIKLILYVLMTQLDVLLTLKRQKLYFIDFCKRFTIKSTFYWFLSPFLMIDSHLNDTWIRKWCVVWSIMTFERLMWVINEWNQRRWCSWVMIKISISTHVLSILGSRLESAGTHTLSQIYF